ncbi:HAMP domain-containing sensor histidine kinase [Luteipulveratus sp. YIM 133132]|uniref:HAMP domain-containing sensor histidine kinase n=1 Tax=Luteipulveratus flavus TaxID=3031728 RepID=UPI0023AF8C29|nr:HAMP domain-containing sensor histidine kinase [Luteipulveratus sp. YIM 133132]MDE9367703.1 HAMP domain-containing sensor histidine kinase [Luteipulveratus sp. YIM 133132]
MTAAARRLSLRWRLMLIGLSGVALALLAGSLVLYAVLGIAGRGALDETARNTAGDIALVAAGGPLPDPLPASGAQSVQVVDAAGRVVGGSANADRLTGLLRPEELARARGGERITVPGRRAGVAGPLRVIALPVTRSGERRDASTVVVAVQAADVVHAERVLATTLLVVAPLLLVVMGLVAWWVIGRALRPVEKLRSGAEAISGEAAATRLPVPEQADEIRALAVTLNGMLDRLAGARERQRGLVADAAHELRSPLASMQTQLEVDQRVRGRDELTDGLLDDVTRLSALVEDLLLLARADAAAWTTGRAETLTVAPLLADVATRYAGARVPLTVLPVAEPNLTARAAPAELRRMLTNLLDNAVRHASSQVRLSARAADGEVLLVVEDDGPGIAPADRERAFERFTRLDDARGRDAGGSGLGLAIVQELARRARGSVALADREPVDGTAPSGLRVELRVPR